MAIGVSELSRNTILHHRENPQNEWHMSSVDEKLNLQGVTYVSKEK